MWNSIVTVPDHCLFLIRIGSDFTSGFRLFLPLVHKLVVQVRNVVANVLFVLPLVLLRLVQVSNQKQELLPLVH